MRSDTMKAKSEAKHTSGPWDYFKHADNSISIMGDTDGADLHVATMLYTGFPEAVEANARLIAQAPELLEALEAMVDTLELFQCGANVDNLPQYKKAKAIIARAKGEKP